MIDEILYFTAVKRFLPLFIPLVILGFVQGRAQTDVQQNISNVLRAESSFYGSDSTSVAIKTFDMDGDHFYVIYRSDEKLMYVISDKRDIILKQEGMNPRFSFADFNADGYNDIIIDYNLALDSVKAALLYDAKNKNFREVKGLKDFPMARKVPGEDLYYSYRTSGCAGFEWVSQLFYIRKNKARSIATMTANQCPGSSTAHGIFIRKDRTRRIEPHDSQPLEVIDNYPQGKWGFLEDYWQKNGKRFR